MSKELSKEIREQIEREALAGQKERANTDYAKGFNLGYETGYEAAGEKYAELWQAAEARIQELFGELEKYSLLVSSKISELQAAEAKIERYEKALKDIINPIAYLQRKAEEEGGLINGHVAQELASSVPFIQSIATEALTPKTSTDERRL